jgi:hypothetical protein
MMATIYEKASEVIVWPGHVHNDGNLSTLLDHNLRSSKLEKSLPQYYILIPEP